MLTIVKLDVGSIDDFHSRDFQSCRTQMTKAMKAMLVHITMLVSNKTFSEHSDCHAHSFFHRL